MYAVNDNPNASKLVKIPTMLLMLMIMLCCFLFQDYKVINVESIEEVKSSGYAVSLKSKLRNVYPALRKHIQIIT